MEITFEFINLKTITTNVSVRITGVTTGEVALDELALSFTTTM
jgi:hypothetical protein